jgi:undecaprenyl-diphosphatase
MEFYISIILGCIQGLTEFLPVSSSGHLVLFQHLFGFKEPAVLLDVVLHLGTLVAVGLYFASDLKLMVKEVIKVTPSFLLPKQDPRWMERYPYAALAVWVAIGSLPTALIGFLFKDPLERLFGSITTVGFMFMLTGLIVASTRLLAKEYNQRKQVGLPTALAVGIAQGIAIIPGISRSGTTIVCGLMCKLERELAARFSFLLSIPAILGATLIKFDLKGLEQIGPGPLLAGFFSALLVGLLVLKILMGIIRKGRFFYFALYCWFIGLVTLGVSFFSS